MLADQRRRPVVRLDSLKLHRQARYRALAGLFAFALVGFAFFDYLTVSLTAFDTSIVEAQQNGTLEAMLVTETPLTRTS